MSKELTIRINTDGEHTISNINIGSSNTIKVDWGDGNTTQWENGTTHTYTNSGEYILTFTNVQSIGNNFLTGNTKITAITIPETVTSIGNNFLQGCTNCQKITFKRTTPPTLGTNPFTNINTYKLYVYETSISSYRGTTNYPTAEASYVKVTTLEQKLHTLGETIRTNLETKGVTTHPTNGLTTLAEKIGDIADLPEDYWSQTGIFNKEWWSDDEPIIHDRKIHCTGDTGYTIYLPEEDEYTIGFIATYHNINDTVSLGNLNIKPLTSFNSIGCPLEVPFFISKKSTDTNIKVWSNASRDVVSMGDTDPVDNVSVNVFVTNGSNVTLSEFIYTTDWYDPDDMDTIPYTPYTYGVCWDDSKTVSNGDTPTTRPANHRIFLKNDEKTIFGETLTSDNIYDYLVTDYGGTGTTQNGLDYWGYTHYLLPEENETYTWITNDELTQNLTAWTSHSYGSGTNRRDIYYNYPHYDIITEPTAFNLPLGEEWEIEFTYNKTSDSNNDGYIEISNNLFSTIFGVHYREAVIRANGSSLNEPSFPSGDSIHFKIYNPIILSRGNNTYSITYYYSINNVNRTFNIIYRLQGDYTLENLQNNRLTYVDVQNDITITDLNVKITSTKDTTILARHLAYNQSVFQISGLLHDEDGEYLQDKSVTIDIINSNNTILDTTTVTTEACGVISDTYTRTSAGSEYANGNISVKFTFDGDEGYNPTTRTMTVNDEDEFQNAMAEPQGSFRNGVLTITGIQVQTLPNTLDSYRITEDWTVDVYDENNNYLTTLTDQNNTYSTQLTTVQTKARLSCPIFSKMKTWSESS